MIYDFDKPIDRRGTNDLKWRPEGLKGYLPIQVSGEMVPMWIADMDLPCPKSVTEAIRKRTEVEIFGYCGRRPEYFAVLRWWYQERYGLELKEELHSVMMGIVTAINMAIRAFSEPGDGVILQQPVYEPFAGLVAKTGRTLVNNALIFENGQYSMDYDLLERQAADPRNKLLILCSPHNPIGRVWTKEELARLSEICKRNGVFVISDEIHSDIVFKGYRHTPFVLAGDVPHMMCTSPAKTFNLAGLKISNLFFSDKAHKDRFDEEVNSYSIGANTTFGVEAVPAAYSPEGAEWLDQLLPYLEANVDLVEEWAKSRGVSFTRPQGSFLCWLDLSSVGLDDDAIQEKIIIGQEVVCVPGPWFGPGGKGHLRLNIGCTHATLNEALRRVDRVLGQ